MSRKVTTPVVHMNGTSLRELLEMYSDAALALQQAQNALDQAAPHERDYYVAPGTWEPARQQHEHRVKKLAEVQAELSAILDHLEMFMED